LFKDFIFSLKPREARVLDRIDIAGTGLEIGPGARPTLKREDGYKIEYLDHLPREELVKKYTGIFEVDKIPEIDHVWNGENYFELTRKKYDFVIASHVIEHSPDLIGFLKNCSSVIRENGNLSLVVPTKVNCFDYFRSLSSLGQIIDAHREGRTRTTVGVVIDAGVRARVGADLSWHHFAHRNPPVMFFENRDPADVGRRLEAGYIDVHNWVFVASWFRFLIENLYQLGYTDLREASFHHGTGSEFFIVLSRQGPGPSESLETLARRAIKEQRPNIWDIPRDIISANLDNIRLRRQRQKG
jgi:SAM-dependent methyltransferase